MCICTTACILCNDADQNLKAINAFLALNLIG